MFLHHIVAYSIDFGRQKRVVKYRRGQDMWTYIAGDKRLPVQWTSWLTHTRIHPPTLEELHADLVRQEHIRQRVALLEATEMDTIRSVSGDSTSLPNSRDSDMQTVDAATTRGQPVGDHQEALPDVEKSSPELVFPSQSLPSDEPEAWVPRTQRRSS
ncbi:hypothetical protein BDY19DRAFT_992545 [Irpex rosettiformis]|uniref:Uncharacterized protein n=1 Tax=Irpex rosettiformis TaxID=378272 RepID=A0ACB8U7R8_9APHY|nr:hypothetical protein BDY19DRAFT_992545 [Irpex rosettiformis]